MSSGLSNEYVENLARLLSDGSFIGCFPIDLLPNINNSNHQISLIINLDPSYKSGSHFVSIFKSKEIFTYFDSFGSEPPKEIIDFIIHFNLPYISNKQKIQSDNSQFCGFFCLGFILAQELGITVQEFTNLFYTKDKKLGDLLRLNDNLIIHFIKSYIKIQLK